MYAVGDFVTAAGRALEGDGVRPDEIVPAREGTPGGRDETLEAALRWLGGEFGAPLALGAPLLLSSDDLQAR